MSAIEAAIALVDALCEQLQHPESRLQSASDRKPYLAVSKSAAAVCASPSPPVLEEADAPKKIAPSASIDAVPAQSKKEKKKKPQPLAAAPMSSADLFGKACLKVAKVLSVSKVDGSDKLYKTQVDVGGGETRQIIAGLQKHVAASCLEGSLVVVITNLKTAKLAGETSEGMILAGVQSDPELPSGELVAPIRPPGNAQAGSRIYLDGSSPSDAPPKVLKSGPWADIKSKLSVAAGGGSYGGIRLVTSAGPLTAVELSDGAAIS